MEIKQYRIPIRKVYEGYKNNLEEGVVGYGGKLNIRPPYQREFIYNALNNIPGVSAVKPEAAFYIFPKIDSKKFNVTDDEKMVLDILKQKHILLTHGGGFHWETPDHFRVVYLPDVTTLNKATDKLTEFFENYKQ